MDTIAVIGAGTQGREIALSALLGGYRTILEDVSPEMLEDAHRWIEQSLNGNSARFAAQPNLSAFTQFSVTDNVNDAIREADLIVDAAPDELEMKLELFTIFDKFAKPGAIFASATSAGSVGDFSDVTVYRERCIGLRFVHSAAHGQRIELTRTPLTSDDTVKACVEVARRMGKETTA